MPKLMSSLFLIGLTCYSGSAAEAANRFDAISNLVNFECVSVADASAVGGTAQYYSLSLSPVSDTSFSVASIAELSDSSNCDATFDVATNTLSGTVRVTDLNYNVDLLFDESSQTFSLISALISGFAETSLWIVSDGNRELYLGGTIHLLHQSDFPLPVAYSIAFNQAETVVFEVDPDIPVVPSSSNTTQLEQGDTFFNYISDSTRAALDQFLALFNSSSAVYTDLKPEFVEVDLTYLGAASQGFVNGVDNYYVNAARTEEKARAGLETFEAQISAIDNSSSDNGSQDWDARISNLLEAIQSGSLAAELGSLIAYWREGRTDLIGLSNSQLQLADPNYYESVFVNRNRNWIPVIESYLQTPEVELVLAGVGHFAGPDNVIELLEALGYSVERFVPQGTF